ncbi:MAG: hypothetical protein K2H01_04985 [Ruminococcus sp.]|nr:hypothetical protein [Ruminococcus sp.]
MNIFKKLFIAFTTVIFMSLFAAASVSAAASDEKALSPAESAPYIILMGIDADKALWEQKEENSQEFSSDSEITLSYSFQTGGSVINKLVLDTNLPASQFPNALININKITLTTASNGTFDIPYNSSKAVLTQNANKCVRLNILYPFGQPTASAIDTSLPASASIGDSLAISFLISGISSSAAGNPVTTTTSADLSEAITTTTTITSFTQADIVQSGNTINSSYSYDTSTGTVSQTADPGIVTIAVTGAAAAALSVGAFTMRKKKKK